MKCSLGISNILKKSLVFPILFFLLFLCFVPLRRLFYLSLLISRTLHSVGYIFPFLLCCSLAFFYELICKVSSDNHFSLLHFFFLGMLLVAISHTSHFSLAQMVKNLPAMQESRVGDIFWRREWQSTPVSLSGESHGQIPGRLQFMGLQGVGHDWATNTYILYNVKNLWS